MRVSTRLIVAYRAYLSDANVFSWLRFTDLKFGSCWQTDFAFDQTFLNGRLSTVVLAPIFDKIKK